MCDDDHLASFPSLAEVRDELLEHRVGIEIFFRLIHDERPAVLTIQCEVEKENYDTLSPPKPGFAIKDISRWSPCFSSMSR